MRHVLGTENNDQVYSGWNEGDRRRAEAFERLNLNTLWKICGLEGGYSDAFESDLWNALYIYRPGPDRYAYLPAKERSRLYIKLENAVSNLLAQMASMDEQIETEIDLEGYGFEPEGFDDSAAAEYAMFTYGGYLIYTLHDQLKTFAEIVSEAKKNSLKPRGKPKQNAGLEQTINDLGEVFRKYSGQAPMTGYRYDELDELQPYKGPFFDFLHATFWTMNGMGKPSSHTIGDATRRAFGLRK